LSSETGDRESVRRRIAANARAAEWERLRNEATRLLEPGAGLDAVNAKAAELQRDKLSAAGRAGRHKQAAKLAQADAILKLLPEAESRILEGLEILRLIQGGEAA
jgi:hypothetical protein